MSVPEIPGPWNDAAETHWLRHASGLRIVLWPNSEREGNWTGAVLDDAARLLFLTTRPTYGAALALCQRYAAAPDGGVIQP